MWALAPHPTDEAGSPLRDQHSHERAAHDRARRAYSAASYADLALPGVTIVEYPRSRWSWALRLVYEHLWF